MSQKQFRFRRPIYIDVFIHRTADGLPFDTELEKAEEMADAIYREKQAKIENSYLGNMERIV